MKIKVVLKKSKYNDLSDKEEEPEIGLVPLDTAESIENRKARKSKALEKKFQVKKKKHLQCKK